MRPLHEIPGRGFLAPALASGIFKDIPASFLPDLRQDDRGAALEQGFEHASRGLLERPFLAFSPTETRRHPGARSFCSMPHTKIRQTAHHQPCPDRTECVRRRPGRIARAQKRRASEHRRAQQRPLLLYLPRRQSRTPQRSGRRSEGLETGGSRRLEAVVKAGMAR